MATHSFTLSSRLIWLYEAELSSCDRDLWVAKPKVFPTWPSTEKVSIASLCSRSTFARLEVCLFYFFHLKLMEGCFARGTNATEQCARWFWRNSQCTKYGNWLQLSVTSKNLTLAHKGQEPKHRELLTSNKHLLTAY